MEPSPLTQDTRPDTFTPKIVQLYERLFSDDVEDFEESEGFWQEFFLHRPDSRNLRRIMSQLPPDDLLHLQVHSQHLFRRAIAAVRAQKSPSDEIALDPDRLTNQTLTVFLGAVLSKKYTNPSSDIISVLTGLNDADKVFMDFVGVLDGVIRGGRSMDVRQKAVRTALTMISGAWGTGLISYFTHRDLFPSLMKCAIDAEDSRHILTPFFLLGLLVNYNKFEFQNPYRLRLDDFVNDQAIKKVVFCVGSTCASARDKYVDIQDDLPESWGLGSTLQMIGLGALAPGSRPTTPAPTADEAKDLFSALPGPEAGILLSAYDFANANKLFCFNFVTSPAESAQMATPLSSFLSLTSYLFQHAHRSTRATAYTYLNLFILQILMEDPALLKRLSSDESKTSVRLCRQRQPFLPVVKGDRIVATIIIDIIMDGINHNLRRRLDIQFYLLCLSTLHRLISHLARNRTRLTFHWTDLWRSLLSFLRFLTLYASSVTALPQAPALAASLTSLIALALTSGESFLPDPAAYDDLFYKLVEVGGSTASSNGKAPESTPNTTNDDVGNTLPAFRDAYGLQKHEGMRTLLSVAAHYRRLLEEKAPGGNRKARLTPKEVSDVIKQGYETLSIEARETLDATAGAAEGRGWRENEWRNEVKRIGRVVVGDAKAIVEIV